MAEKKGRKILNYALLIVAIIIILDLVLVALNKDFSKISSKDKEETENFVFSGNSTFVMMKLPAVDNEGKGVSTVLSVEAVPGKGRTLVDIENLLFWADTQQSIRMARLVANNYTKNKIENYNLIYNVEANASLIGGPSAGVALAIATIFALNGEKPREDVMITGTINHDGSIGPVSAILEKAKASKEAGASLFLVPLLQSRDVIYETNQHCEKFGFTEICQTETIPRKVNVSEQTGIEVVEVGSIEEALKYFKS